MPTKPWFPPDTAESPRERLLFCFPHAGGDPRAFLDWQPGIGNAAAVVAVGMPGRGHLLGQVAPAGIAELADGVAGAIAEAADRPVYLFGHSLGALIAFEVARRLGGLPALRHLVASGCAAPSLVPAPDIVRVAELEGRAFAEAVAFLGGLPPELLADPELSELLLPVLRADARLVAGYRYRPAAPLPIGVSLINGINDPLVDDAALQPWQRECIRPPACHWVAGGHFFFARKPQAVVDVLSALFRADSAAVPADRHVELI
jgi:surfactin synthase thioesterase subunit